MNNKKTSRPRISYKFAMKAFVAALAVSALGYFVYSQVQDTAVVNAQAETKALPTIEIQFGDARDSKPNLPGECEKQIGTNIGSGYDSASVAFDNDDPDCLRVRITDSANTVYSQDFRFCLQHKSAGLGPAYEDTISCTGWASENIGITTSGPQANPRRGNLFHSMYAVGQISGPPPYYMEKVTRPFACTNGMKKPDCADLPSGTTIGDIEVGVSLFYQKDSGNCQQSAGPRFARQGGAWSQWAYGDSRDDDPGCYQAWMRAGTINAPWDAEYVTDNIPDIMTPGVHDNDYSITMRNLGRPWILQDFDFDNNSTIVKAATKCSMDINDYSSDPNSPNNECRDYQILSSPDIRLKRIDNPEDAREETIETRSKPVRAGEIFYTPSGGWSHTGPDRDITAAGPMTIDNTIPFYVKQDIVYKRVKQTYTSCYSYEDEPPKPIKEDFGGELETYQVSGLFHKFKQIFGIKSAIAQSPSEQPQLVEPERPPEDNCWTEEFEYISQVRSPINPNIYSGKGKDSEAEFAPIDITIPAGASGTYVLRVRMVYLPDQLLFGTHGDIPITIPEGTSLVCDISKTVTAGTEARYNLSVNGTASGSYSVTMTSNPTGPVLNNSPVVLNSANSYRSEALVGTTGVPPGTYTLTFTPTGNLAPCLATLIIEQPAPTVEIRFNNQLVSANVADNSTGKISYTTANVKAGCIKRTIPATSEASVRWRGTFSQPNPSASWPLGVETGPFYSTEQPYIFSLTCIGLNDQTVSSSVTVYVNQPVVTKVALQCLGDRDNPQAQSDGPCRASYDSSAKLFWQNENATSCSINQGIGTVSNPTSGNTMTGNLTTAGTIIFTMTCNSPPGATTQFVTDNVSIIVDSPPAPIVSLRCKGKEAAFSDGPCKVNSGQTGQLDWTSAYANSCTIDNNIGSVSPDGGTRTTQQLTYDTTFTLSCTGSTTVEDKVKFEIDSGPTGFTSPPIRHDASPCEKVRLSWVNSAIDNQNAYQEYEVWRGKKGEAGSEKVATITTPDGVINNTMTVEDSYPAAKTENNWYYLYARYGAEWSTPSSILANVVRCVPDLSSSDKDLVSVTGRISTEFTPNSCSGSSRPNVVDLPGNAIFSVGDRITFELHVCNTGQADSGSIRVVDRLYNQNNNETKGALINPVIIRNSVTKFGNRDCARQVDTESGRNDEIEFIIQNLGIMQTCSLRFTATLQKPVSPSSNVFRFQNTGDIIVDSYPEKNTSYYTPPYLFSLDGVPNREETSPIR